MNAQSTKYNGWLPPWRVQKIRVALTGWLNFVLRGYYHAISEEKLEESLADSVMFVLLTNIVLHENAFDHGAVALPSSDAEKSHNVRVCFSLFEKKNVHFKCKPAHVLQHSSSQYTFPMLVTILCYFYGKYLHGGERDRPDYSSDLTMEINTVLSKLEPRPPTITDLDTSWADGLNFCRLMKVYAPGSINLDAASTMSPLDRMKLAQRVAQEELQVPMICPPDDIVHDVEVTVIVIYASVIVWAAKTQASRLAASDYEKMVQLEERVKLLEGDLVTQEMQMQHLRKEHTLALASEHHDSDPQGRVQALYTRLAELEEKQDDFDRLKDELEKVKVMKAETEKHAQAELAKLGLERDRLELQFKQALAASQAVAHKVRVLARELESNKADSVQRMRQQRSAATIHVEPPSGRCAILFADIQGASRLWLQHSDIAATSLRVYNELIGQKLGQYGGYQAAREGDAFMAVFSSCVSALECCLDIQVSALSAEWPSMLTDLTTEEFKTVVLANGSIVHRGLRIRMGLHAGHVAPVEDLALRRFDYRGAEIEIAAGVEALTVGGQILVSASFQNMIADRLKECKYTPLVRDLGLIPIDGVHERVRIFEFTPNVLSGRDFPSARETRTRYEEAPNQLANELDKAILETKNLLVTLQGLGDELQTSSAEVEHVGSSIASLAERPEAEFFLAELARIKGLMERFEQRRVATVTLVDRGRMSVLDNEKQLLALIDKIHQKSASAGEAVTSATSSALAASQVLIKGREEAKFRKQREKLERDNQMLMAKVSSLEQTNRMLARTRGAPTMSRTGPAPSGTPTSTGPGTRFNSLANASGFLPELDSSQDRDNDVMDNSASGISIVHAESFNQSAFSMSPMSAVQSSKSSPGLVSLSRAADHEEEKARRAAAVTLQPRGGLRKQRSASSVPSEESPDSSGGGAALAREKDGSDPELRAASETPDDRDVLRSHSPHSPNELDLGDHDHHEHHRERDRSRDRDPRAHRSHGHDNDRSGMLKGLHQKGSGGALQRDKEAAQRDREAREARDKEARDRDAHDMVRLHHNLGSADSISSSRDRDLDRSRDHDRFRGLQGLHDKGSSGSLIPRDRSHDHESSRDRERHREDREHHGERHREDRDREHHGGRQRSRSRGHDDRESRGPSRAESISSMAQMPTLAPGGPAPEITAEEQVDGDRRARVKKASKSFQGDVSTLNPSVKMLGDTPKSISEGGRSLAKSVEYHLGASPQANLGTSSPLPHIDDSRGRNTVTSLPASGHHPRRIRAVRDSSAKQKLGSPQLRGGPGALPAISPTNLPHVPEDEITCELSVDESGVVDFSFNVGDL